MYPDFNVKLYRELYYDLKPYNDNKLFEHYHKHGHEEGRICTLNKFYEVFPLSFIVSDLRCIKVS